VEVSWGRFLGGVDGFGRAGPGGHLCFFFFFLTVCILEFLLKNAGGGPFLRIFRRASAGMRFTL